MSMVWLLVSADGITGVMVLLVSRFAALEPSRETMLDSGRTLDEEAATLETAIGKNIKLINPQ